MNSNIYNIRIIGCDGTTKFTMELSEEEVAVLYELQEMSRIHSSSACMPTLEVRKETDA